MNAKQQNKAQREYAGDDAMQMTLLLLLEQGGEPDVKEYQSERN